MEVRTSRFVAPLLLDWNVQQVGPEAHLTLIVLFLPLRLKDHCQD